MSTTTVNNFTKDTYGNAQPNFGGDVACIQGIVNFDDVGAVTLGSLPAGATVVDWSIAEVIDFDAGTNNNMDLGITGNGDYFANDVAIGTQGVQRMGVSGTDFTSIGVKFTAPTLITATYTQSGDAAEQGSALITIYYRVDSAT
jgi:hypothetical protein